MAAYTGRHLVEIPLSRIRTCDELKRAFYLNSYDTIELDFSNKLIVFEDIDCSKLFDSSFCSEQLKTIFVLVSSIIKKRSETSTADSVTSDVDSLIVHLEQSDIDTRKKKLSKKDLRSLLGESE
jgi:hypothetical protein